MTPSWHEYEKWLGSTLLSTLPEHLPAPTIKAWGTDSRSISKNTWFVPIKGENFDGHDFINAAMASGAAGFLFEDGAAEKIEEKYLGAGIKVQDTLAAYQSIGTGWRGTLKSTTVAAITGSVGKTTTKEMISCVFRNAGSCFSTTASFNNEIGVPKSLLSIDESHRYAVLEFGAKKKGDIKFLCDLARPDITILLNIGVSHLGVFGSQENLRDTKLEIFRDSGENCILVANHDDPVIVEAGKNTGKKQVTFGQHPDATVRIITANANFDRGQTDIELNIGRKSYRLTLNSCHSAFPKNAAAAIAAGLAADIPIAVAIEGLEKFEPIVGRFKIMRGKRLTVIDDTYNANPDSMKAGLSSVFKQFPGKKINLLLGDMLELGDESAEMHIDIGRFLSQCSVGRLTTVGELAQHYHLKNGKDGTHFKTVEDAILQSANVIEGAEVLFVKGSNGIRLSRFLSHLQANEILP